MDARTMYFLPRYFSIVFAFAGDSTTTKVFDAVFRVVFAAVFFAVAFFAVVLFAAAFFAAVVFTADFFAVVVFAADFFAAEVFTFAAFAAFPVLSVFFSCGVSFCTVGKIAPPQILKNPSLLKLYFPAALRTYVRMGVSSTRPLTRKPNRRNATFAALPCRRQISSSRESASSRERSA